MGLKTEVNLLEVTGDQGRNNLGSEGGTSQNGEGLTRKSIMRTWRKGNPHF